MPARRLSIRKIKEVLRLRLGLALTEEQIARSCNIAEATADRYLERAEAAGLSWPSAAEIKERQLAEQLFPTTPVWEPQTMRPMPDWAAIHQQFWKAEARTSGRSPAIRDSRRSAGLLYVFCYFEVWSDKRRGGNPTHACRARFA